MIRNGEVLKPHPKQALFGACPARFCLAMAGAQSGKTIATAPKFMSRVAETYNRLLKANGGRAWTKDQRGRVAPIARFWVVDPSYALAQQAQEYLLEYWEAPECRWESWSSSAGIFMRCWPRPGCVVEFRSGEKPETLVSKPVNGLWLNEAARLKEAAWANLRSRIATTRGWVLLDSTPLGENWVYKNFYLRGLPNDHPDFVKNEWRPHHCTHTWFSADNPAISPEEVEEARRTMAPWAFKREWEGDPHNFAGQVFPHWIDSVNIKATRAEDYPELEVGMDFGFGPGHPFVVVVVGLDFKRRRFGIIEEHVHEGMLLDAQCDLLAQVCAVHQRVRRATGDSADPGMLATMRARRKGRHVDIVGADKDVYEGVCAQADMIGDGSYQIDPSCSVSIRQHKGYRWKPRRENDPTAEFHEEPLRKDDDTVAAARYVLYPRLGRAVRKAA